jgi:hypothetical protein
MPPSREAIQQLMAAQIRSVADQRPLHVEASVARNAIRPATVTFRIVPQNDGPKQPGRRLQDSTVQLGRRMTAALSAQHTDQRHRPVTHAQIDKDEVVAAGAFEKKATEKRRRAVSTSLAMLQGFLLACFLLLFLSLRSFVCLLDAVLFYLACA